MELEAVALIALSAVACFAAAGGWVSHVKNRPPLEGFFLGALLGPVGLIVELRRPFAHQNLCISSKRSGSASDKSVSKMPAAMALTVTPKTEASRDRHLVKPMMAALEVA